MTPPQSGEPASPFRRSRAAEIWLHKATVNERQKESLDRLGGDKTLFDALKAARFRGPDWDFVAQELARYGLAVIGKWIRTGSIIQKCRERNVKGVMDLPEWVRLDFQLTDAITSEVVADAITKYQTDVLEKGKWDPARGASLRTFFIGQCMFRYPTVYKRLVVNKHRDQHTDDNGFLEDLASRTPVSAVDDDAINSAMTSHLLRQASSHRARKALAMNALDYDYATIAAHLGGTVDSVKGLLKREKDRIRKNEAGKGTA